MARVRFYLATSLFVMAALTIRLTFLKNVNRQVAGNVPIG